MGDSGNEQLSSEKRCTVCHRFQMGLVIKSFKQLREKMSLLSLRLGFLSPKLSI